VLLAAGFVALGSGVAFADGDIATSGNGSILGGNQIVADADVPINVCGNAVSAVLGVSGAQCTDSDAIVVDRGGNDIHTSGNGSILGGNQIVGHADVPVNITGNAIGAVGGVAGAASTDADSVVVHDHAHSGDPDIATSGNGSILGGNQLVGEADVPINISGNAISAVGGVAGAAATDADAIVHEHEHRHGHRHGHGYGHGHGHGHAHDSGPDIATSGNGSILGGNQGVIDLDVPVNVAGNAIGAVGGVAGAAATDSDAIVHEHEHGHGHGHHGHRGHGHHGYDGHRAHQAAPSAGTVVGEVVDGVSLLPDTSGVDVGVARQSAPAERQHQSMGGPDIATSGNGSILGGNQAVVDLDVPVNVAGNAIGAVGGMAGAAATDSDAVVLHDDHDIATSGNGSVGGGNQLVADADVPVNVAGNAVGAVLGVAGASTTDSDAVVVHDRAPVEHQSGVLDAAPIVNELPEVPVSEALPVDYTLSETTAQAVEEHAPEHADQLPQAPNPVDEVLGLAGVGL
jgi:ligand-binding sensor protein